MINFAPRSRSIGEFKVHDISGSYAMRAGELAMKTIAMPIRKSDRIIRPTFFPTTSIVASSDGNVEQFWSGPISCVDSQNRNYRFDDSHRTTLS